MTSAPYSSELCIQVSFIIEGNFTTLLVLHSNIAKKHIFEQKHKFLARHL